MEGLQAKVTKAVIYSNPGTMETEVVELPIEAPGPGQVLVRVLYSGVCHTDYSLCTNSWKAPVTVPKGQIGGHEGVGQVIAQGPGVVNPQVGAKVGIKYVASACLSCRYCLLGKEANCIAAKLSGVFHPGTFQQYLLAASNYVTLIPDNVTDDALPGLAPIMCAGITVYTALKNTDLRPGEWVAVSGGGGGLGHLAIQYAKAMGYLVVALDVGGKESVCIEAGADHFVDVLGFTKSEELCHQVVKLTGGGARVALVCSSSNAAYAQAIYYLDQAGTLVCLGVPEGEPKPIETASVPLLVSRQIRIIGSKVGDRADAHECVRMAVNGAVKTHYQLRKMEELSDVFAEMEEGKVSGRVVLDLR